MTSYRSAEVQPGTQQSCVHTCNVVVGYVSDMFAKGGDLEAAVLVRVTGGAIELLSCLKTLKRRLLCRR